VSIPARRLLPALLLACSAGQSPPAPEPPPAVAPTPAPAPAPPVPEASQPVPEASPAPVATTRGPLEITFAGDIIFGRYRSDNMFDPIPGPDDHPFAEISEQLRADIIVGNLETPLTRDLPLKSPIGARYRFGASKEMARHLVDAGFTAVSLANNHAFDLRAAGMTDSPVILRELGIIPLGASRTELPTFRVELVERAGWRVGFLAVTTRRNAPHFEGTPVLPFLITTELDDVLVPVLQAARADHDLLIVFIHWGEEYADDPAVHQRKAAKALLDAGADLVVGHHPHVLQGIERHGDGAIAYSLGNFLFENTNAVPKLTGVLRARFDARRCLEALTFHPAYIKRTPSKHPAPATEGMGKQVRKRMTDLSARLGTELETSGEDLRLAGFACDKPAP
jgi:poly-gamma-glutamate capsule biosynthesis protein CapA/YwtB (metallophosphatase superfamily)